MVGTLLSIGLMAIGAVGVLVAARRTHLAGQQLDFLKTLGQDADHVSQPIALPDLVQTPLVKRLFGPLAEQMRHSLSKLYPSRDIDRVHASLLKAGLTGSVRAEEFVSLQVSSVLIGFAVTLTLLATGTGGVKLGVACLILLPLLGAMGPSYWLKSRISHRFDEVTNDLPDVLDLMTISVAAGLGLEQAMQVSCSHFDSAVSSELKLTLREMELGLSRHDALENLKLRTDIDDLVTFSVVLSQADSLGLPIGRVLQAQADEMRDKRRQRARERAAKVPIKILFPLMFCFMPAVMVLVIGPLVGPMRAAFH